MNLYGVKYNQNASFDQKISQYWVIEVTKFLIEIMKCLMLDHH